jgi:NAD(P)-dependent dehydrogenase (short-subunit alcohol dehydrogenase family)
VAIVYLAAEQSDAEEAKKAVEAEGRKCLLLPGDVTDPKFCTGAVEKTVAEFDRLDVLVNNAAYQQRQDKIEDVTDEQFEKTYGPTSSATSTWRGRRLRTCRRAGRS